MVISVAPMASSGVAVAARISNTPTRALTSRARKRNSINESVAAMTGEKNRTPNSLSPHIVVPRNCA